MTRLKIAIATAGRFHVLDLARELHALGHEVRFYSYVPRARARRFGLPAKCHVALLPFTAPLVVWERLFPGLLPRLRERLLYVMLNAATMLRLRRCDVFICMSGIYLEAARYARWRFGAKIWLHRGSRHILSQDEILAEIPGAERPGPLAIRRELAGYALADRIVIQSRQVEESFSRDRDLCAKLFRNPTGVSLAMFPFRGYKPASAPVSLIFVGNSSLRKGCDVLTEAIRRVAGTRLTHIGAIGDFAFPTRDPRFTHINHVPQPRLAQYYAEADVLALASREEGMSAVLMQALAAGLPIICTDRTGGADLAYTPALAARITVIPSGNVDALTVAIAAWRDRLRRGDPLPPLLERDRQLLSWSAYALRHSDELLRALG